MTSPRPLQHIDPLAGVLHQRVAIVVVHRDVTRSRYNRSMADNPTADELRTMLVTILAGATDVPEGSWDARLGEMVRIDLTRSPASNWTISAKGKDARSVEHAVALVRAQTPYCRW